MLIQDFKDRELKYLANVNVLSTGFDAPVVDCIVMLRPTLSPGLYYQQVGRGFRIFEGKENTLVLDYVGNVMEHGPIDAIQIKSKKGKHGDDEAPAKKCPECLSLVHPGYSQGPDCGYEFPPKKKARHTDEAMDANVISGPAVDTEYEVQEISYDVHIKAGASDNAPKTMRVEYVLGWQHWQSEWVCFEHSGYAKERAIEWWVARSKMPIPMNTQEAVNFANSGALAEPKVIIVRSTPGQKYDQIVDYEGMSAKPEISEEMFKRAEEQSKKAALDWVDEDSVPF